MAKFERTSKELNLKEEEEKYNAKLEQAQDSVYKRIIEQFGEEISPMMYLTKSKPSVPVNFRSFESVPNNAEILKDNKYTPFKTMSEVYRAASYLGMLLLFHKYNIEKVDPYAKRLVKLIEKREKRVLSAFLDDTIIEEIDKIYEFCRQGRMEYSEGAEDANELLKEVDPKRIQYYKQYTENVFAHRKPIHVFEKSTKSRPKNE